MLKNTVDWPIHRVEVSKNNTFQVKEKTKLLIDIIGEQRLFLSSVKWYILEKILFISPILFADPKESFIVFIDIKRNQIFLEKFAEFHF